MHLVYLVCIPIDQFSCVQLLAFICERISHAKIKLLKGHVIEELQSHFIIIIQVMWAILEDKTVVIIILVH